MQIGLDLDEVVAELMNSLLRYYNRKFGRRLKKEDFFSYNLWEVWGGNREGAIGIVQDFFDSPFFEEILPVKGSIDGVDYLVDKHSLHIVTARPSLVKDKTEKWIRKYFDNKFKTITFTNTYTLSEKSLSKANVCKDLGIDVFIEDNSEYALKCASDGIKAILFGDCAWSKNCPSHPNIKRAENWEEVLGYFK